MKLIVKRISGPDCIIEVNGQDEMMALKQQVENAWATPAHALRLVFKGRTLTDEKTVNDCGLKDGDKVYVVVKKDQLGTPEPRPVQRQSPDPNSLLWQRLHVFLKKHFREQDIQSILQAFQKEFDKTMDGLSLDDIERLSVANLNSKT